MTRSPSKKWLTLLTAAGLVLALAGCTGGAKNPGSSSSTSTGKLDKITFLLDWTPNTNHTGVYVARDKGYYKAHGIEVAIQQASDAGVLSQLAAGNGQFGISFQEEIASALTSDSPLDVKAVAAVIQHNTSGIVSLKKTGITSPKLLEGKRYATWDSPIEQAILKNVMQKDGGDFGKVVLMHQTVDNVIAALQSNIDAVWIYYAWDGIACKVKGLDTNYFAFKDSNPALDFYTPVLAASTKWLKANPDLAKRFLDATKEGYEYAIAHPEDAANLLVKDAPGVDSAIATESQKWLAGQYKAEVSRWGYIDQTRWDTFYAWMHDNGVLAKKLAAGAGFTDDYLPQ